MNRKFIGISIILSGILLLVGVVYVVFLDGFSFYEFFGKSAEEGIVQENIEDQATGEEGKIIPIKKEAKKIIAVQTQLNTETEEEKKRNTEQPQRSASVSKDDLMRMAGSFTERFGSYSNQSNFSNIVDLKIFMSKRMKKWADTFIANELQKGTVNDIYYGIVTKAVAHEVLELDDYVGEASILVKTRRREATSSTSNVSQVFDQSIIINFVKELGAWKVDSANWQSK